MQAYDSPFNDPTREGAMRSAGAHVISLQHLVDNSNEERQKGEYMVCVILAITNTGTAQTRGRTNGQYGRPQQNTPYQQMFRCMCINCDSGRNAFTMFFGEGEGGRMFHASMEQRDNGTFSENLCVCFIFTSSAKGETLTNVNGQGLELFCHSKSNASPRVHGEQ